MRLRRINLVQSSLTGVLVLELNFFLTWWYEGVRGAQDRRALHHCLHRHQRCRQVNILVEGDCPNTSIPPSHPIDLVAPGN